MSIKPLAALADEELAQRAGQVEDNECFAELFARYRKKVFYACRGFFSDSQAAEDPTQETLLRAYRNIRAFRQGDFSAWLIRIVKNVCIDEWRRSRRETGIDEIEGGKAVSEPADSSLRRAWWPSGSCKKSVCCLASSGSCLELRIEGFSYEETAVRTGLPVGAVKSRIRNGRRMLWRTTEGALGQFVKS